MSGRDGGRRLSPEAVDRLEAGVRATRAAVGARGRRRRAARAAAALVLALGVVLTARAWVVRGPAIQTPLAVMPVPVSLPEPVAAQTASKASTRVVDEATDEDLTQVLRQLGTPGLVRVGDKVYRATDLVLELPKKPSPSSRGSDSNPEASAV